MNRQIAFFILDSLRNYTARVLALGIVSMRKSHIFRCSRAFVLSLSFVDPPIARSSYRRDKSSLFISTSLARSFPFLVPFSLSLSFFRTHPLAHMHTRIQTRTRACRYAEMSYKHAFAQLLWTKIFRQEYNSGIKNFSTLKNTNLS